MTPRRTTLQIDVTSHHGFKIISLSGNIEHLKDSISFKSLINSLVEEKNLQIAVDLKDLNYIDSSAVNVMIYGRSTLEKLGGRFIILEPNSYIVDVLAVLGLTDLFTIIPEKDKLH